MRRFFPVLIVSLAIAGTAFAGGSPKAFEKFVGNYEGTGTYKDQTTFQTVTGTIENEGTLAMASSPRSAVLEMEGTVELSNGGKYPMAMEVTFRRKNVCLVKIVYLSGTVEMTGKYEAKKRRVKISGTVRYIGGGVTRLGATTGTMRLSSGKITYFQKDTLAGEVVTIRETLTKE